MATFSTVLEGRVPMEGESLASSRTGVESDHCRYLGHVYYLAGSLF